MTRADSRLRTCTNCAARTVPIPWPGIGAAVCAVCLQAFPVGITGTVHPMPKPKSTPPKRTKAQQEARRRNKQRKRQRIFERDGFKCAECGATKHLTIDHIIPSSKGGSNHSDNLRTLCKPCNERKADSVDAST